MIRADVLVIGGGGAGCSAAIEASRHGARVTIVSKGPLGTSGITPMTMAGGQACWSSDDSPELMFSDTVKAGGHLNEENLVKLLAEKSMEYYVKFLESLGVRFEFPNARSAGHSRPRETRVGDRTGKVIMNALSSEIARRKITLLENIMITSLLNIGDEVVGAIGVDISSGESMLLSAKATILATGGMQVMWSLHTTHPHDTGDGMAMAYRIGAEIVDPEFMQFHSWTLAYPESIRGVIYPNIGFAYEKGGKYRNKNGEAFMEKYDPVNKEYATRDVKARALFTEIMEGRGTAHGAVYFDHTPIKSQGLEKEFAEKSIGGLDYLEACGFVLHKFLSKPVEVTTAAHYCCGGIRINEKAETSLKGLYAAGEVAGGVHGANRLDSNSLTDVFVFGKIAGEHAAECSKSRESVPIDEYSVSVNKELEKAEKLLEQSPKDALRPVECRKKLQKAMTHYANVVKDKDGLEKALRIVDEIEKNDVPRLYVSDKNKAYNYEWMEALELLNLVDCAKMYLKSALKRTESRGCHVRTDFPKRDDINWQRHTFVKKVDGEMVIATCPRIENT